MRLVSFRSLQDDATLRELLASPESRLVERKREADRGEIAKVVAGFANTAGGWLLLGVDDSGDLVGWEGGGRAHLSDWLRDALEERIDPEVDTFEAGRFTVDGVTIGVVRVAPSRDAPHFVNDTPYERRNGQTRRMRPDRVRQLYGRAGGENEASALARLEDRETFVDIADALNAPRATKAMHGRDIASIVRLSLLEPSRALQDWVHTPEALERSCAFLDSVIPQLSRFGPEFVLDRRAAVATTTAEGHTAAASWSDDPLSELALGWDGRGLAGVRASGQRRQDGPWTFTSDQVRDRWLFPPIAHIMEALQDIGEAGPVLVRWDLRGVTGGHVVGVIPGTNSVRASGFIPANRGNAIEITITTDLAAAPEDVADDLWTKLERLTGAR